MGHIPVYGIEHTFLDEKTGRNSGNRQPFLVSAHA